MPITEYIGILFQKSKGCSWDDVRNTLLEKAKAKGFDTTSKDFHLVVSKMPCGYIITYKTVDDIPKVDTPCPCGDKTHWLVKYRQLD